MIFLFLKGKGVLSKEQQDVIRNEKNVTVLESWVEIASKAESTEQFLNEM